MRAYELTRSAWLRFMRHRRPAGRVVVEENLARAELELRARRAINAAFGLADDD